MGDRAAGRSIAGREAAAGVILRGMQWLARIWDEFLSDNPVIGIRGMAVLAFAAVLGANLCRVLHRGAVADGLDSASVVFTGILMFQCFRLRPGQAEDSSEKGLTGLHLSR